MVIGLYDNLNKGLRFWRDLKDLEIASVSLLVCNNSKTFIIRRILSYVKQFIKLSFSYKKLFFQLLINKNSKISINSIDHPKTILWIKQKKPDVGYHGMGIIYSKEIISLFKIGIINTHIGILPKYRGRSVMEWSLLHGDPAGITTFFIDKGIDTGRRIILVERIDLKQFKDIISAKNYLFSLGNSMLKKALYKLVDKKFEFKINDISKGKRYYVMSDLFREVVNKILNFA